ncbi:MAG: hypothetical protein IJK64_10180 [Clostridia bacterium]|nr:hypothetical protein [Clostridia bacterium]
MKKTLAILCALVIAVSFLALTGCGSKEIPADSPYIGIWKATKATLKEEETDIAEVLDGKTWVFELNADGTAKVISGDEVSGGAWSITGKGFKVKLDDAKSSIKFTAEGDALYTKLIGVKIYFEKVTTLDDVAEDVGAVVDDAASIVGDALSGIASENP